MLTTAGRRQQQVERAVLKLARGHRPTWRRRSGDPAWFDEAAALERVHSMSVATADREHLEQWIEEGWFVADGLLGDHMIDELNAAMDAVWTTSTAIPGLRVLDVDGRPEVPHEELVALPVSERERLYAASSWRLHGFQDHTAAAEVVFRSPLISHQASLILGAAVRPIASINFMRGSQQALHQDMAVFHIHPGNRLVGAWIVRCCSGTGC
jgi:phytanoyl-CoA hydroxylase